MAEIINNSNILFIISIAISVLSLSAAVFAVIKYRGVSKKYESFMRGRNAESLENIFLKTLDRIDRLEEEDISNKTAMRTMNRNVRASVQKIGIVHYNAFEGMGGKMSFACAMLDYTNTGIILNCMHGSEGCFLYVKEVEAGTTDTPLGAEEKEALEKALGYIS